MSERKVFTLEHIHGGKGGETKVGVGSRSEDGYLYLTLNTVLVSSDGNEVNEITTRVRVGDEERQLLADALAFPCEANCFRCNGTSALGNKVFNACLGCMFRSRAGAL